MIDLKTIAKNDPLKRNVEKGLEQMEHTPMDPPAAYEQPGIVDEKELMQEKSLVEFVDEHKTALTEIESFEKSLIDFKTNGFMLNAEINSCFGKFFKYFDEELLQHNRKEEKTLFPVLQKKLMAAGEHSTGLHPVTAIDVMEDDHVKFIQLGALVFNLLGLATRIQDTPSRIFVLDTAYENARELLELLKLHIYREDHTLFPLAKKFLSKEEFEELEKEMAKH